MRLESSPSKKSSSKPSPASDDELSFDNFKCLSAAPLTSHTLLMNRSDLEQSSHRKQPPVVKFKRGFKSQKGSQESQIDGTLSAIAPLRKKYRFCKRRKDGTTSYHRGREDSLTPGPCHWRRGSSRRGQERAKQVHFFDGKKVRSTST